MALGIAALAGGGLWDGVENFFGKEDRRNARKEARRAEQELELQRNAEAGMREATEGYLVEGRESLEELNRRNEEIYAPMEQELVDEINSGDGGKRDAALAAGNFGEQFDLAQADLERRQMAGGVMPGSDQMRRSQERAAYERAIGAAGAATDARTEGADREFMRKNAFYQNNGASMEGRLNDRMRQLYGAEYAAGADTASTHAAARNFHQANQQQYASQANAGLNFVMQAGATGAALATGGAFSARPAPAPAPAQSPNTQAQHGATVAQNRTDAGVATAVQTPKLQRNFGI